MPQKIIVWFQRPHGVWVNIGESIYPYLAEQKAEEFDRYGIGRRKGYVKVLPEGQSPGPVEE